MILPLPLLQGNPLSELVKNERAAQVREEQRQQAEAEFRATHTFKPNLTQRSRAAAALALDRAAAQAGDGSGGRPSRVIPTAKLRLADQASLGWLTGCSRRASAGCGGFGYLPRGWRRPALRQAHTA